MLNDIETYTNKDPNMLTKSVRALLKNGRTKIIEESPLL